MANTYIAIATTTVGVGGSANIQFDNIPATYTDLRLAASLRTTTNDGYQSVTVSFNGSPSYLLKRLYNVGGDSANANYWGIAPADSASLMTANTFGSLSMYIPNYTKTTNKLASIDVVVENNVSGGVSWQGLNAGSATLNSAITTITLAPYGSGNFKQYSTATLYGIKKN